MTVPVIRFKMKAFHFTLEAVRTVRQRQEQKAMEGYAQALLGRQRALENLDAAQRQLNAAYQEMRQKMERGCTAAQAAQMQAFNQSLVKRRDEFTTALTVAERRVNLALRAMLTARQQRGIVDKYHDKQKLRHQREEIRIEQKHTDELASRRTNSSLTWNSTGAVT
jgi:flagellar export protein FliJ